MRSRTMALCLCLTLLLPGCWDRTEIEDTAYIISMGVDTAGKEYLWTFRIVEAEQLPVGMLSVKPTRPEERLASGLITARAANLEQAIKVSQAGLVRVLSLDHLRDVLIGEDLARQGLRPILSQLQRHYQVRRGPGMQVAAGRAVEIFTANRPIEESNPAKFMEGVLLVQKRFHLSPPTRLHHFYARLESQGVDPILALVAINPLTNEPIGSDLPPFGERSLQAGQFPRTGGNPVETAGTAVFRKDRLAGILNVDETIALLALRGEMGKVYQSVPDPDYEGRYITFRYGQETKPQYRARFVDRRPVIAIKLVIDAELLAAPTGTNYTDAEQRRRLERYVSRHLKEQVYNPLVRKLYNEWHSDPIGLGQLFRHQFPNFNAWLDYPWHEQLKEAQVTVETDLFIRRYGLLLE